VVMTPKSLLRHPLTASAPNELAEGRFQLVIDDESAAANASKVRRLVLCSGKIAVDLVTSEPRKANQNVAIARVEQVYPFPEQEVRELLERYPKTREVCWVQEEPENMGAWEFFRPLLEELLNGRCPLRYIGRPRSASPSEGSAAWHQLNQKTLIERAFDLRGEVDTPRPVVKEVRSLTGSKR